LFERVGGWRRVEDWVRRKRKYPWSWRRERRRREREEWNPTRDPKGEGRLWELKFEWDFWRLPLEEEEKELPYRSYRWTFELLHPPTSKALKVLTVSPPSNARRVLLLLRSRSTTTTTISPFRRTKTAFWLEEL